MASSGSKIKRVTDPLDDRVKARLFGGASYDASSGSEHSASAAVSDDDSPCLSELVHSFLEDDQDSAAKQTGYNSDTNRVDSNINDDDDDDTDSVEVIIKLTSLNNKDSCRNLLMAHVLKAMEMLSFFKKDKSIFRRNVMAYLQKAGHNAAICKTKWNSSGGLTAGSYEFIDVVQSVPSTLSPQNRYFVDLDFASEFEIARPTDEYSRLLRYLPRVFVGKNEELKKIVRVMCDSARRSLKREQLSVPPWRKNRYIQNKWFAPYRRTTNQIPVCSSGLLKPSAMNPIPVNVVQCRYVGFDDSVNGRLLVRTRS